MKFLLKVNIPNDGGNAAARAGKLGETIKEILEEQKPEAVYFSDDRGQRCGYLFIEMADASQIPTFAEPWFLAFNAQIELHPIIGKSVGVIHNANSSNDSPRLGKTAAARIFHD